MDNHAKLLSLTMSSAVLTDRELAVLAVSVTEMLQNGLDPYHQEYVIEVDRWLHYEHMCLQSRVSMALVWLLSVVFPLRTQKP